MVSYIIILAWPTFVATFANITTNSKKNISICGENQLRYKLIFFVIALIPLIYFTATRSLSFGDTSVYSFEFSKMPSSFNEIKSYMTTVRKDEFFYLLSTLIKIFITKNTTVYFAIISIIQIAILIHVYRKYSESAFLSFFLFFASTDYISWMYNGIRQFTAVCLTFACFGLIVKKKYLPTILVACFASFFHGTALIIIPFIFIAQGKAWNKKTLLFILAAISTVLFVDQFTDILDEILVDTQYSNVISDWQTSNDDGTNFIRVIVYCIPSMLALIGRKKINAENNTIINLCTNMSVAAAGFYIISMFTSGIFMGRLPIYFSLYSYILLPWELKHIFSKDVEKAVTTIMIIAYICFYFYSLKFGFNLI